MSQPNKPDSRKKLGNWGEKVAALHLEGLGYTILARNWRCAFGEIDIVAQKPTPEGPLIAFVEVKTRRGRSMGSPEEAITPRKAQKLVQLAQMYLGENDVGDVDWQIDLVAIELDRQGKLIRCEHLPNMVWG